MLYSEEYKEDYERRFNAYIMLIIKGSFKDFLRSRQKEEFKISLNECLENGIELLEVVVGEIDINYEERTNASKLEVLMSTPKMYQAVKPLTYKEKLAVFLHFVEGKSTSEVARLMGFYDRSAVNKILRKAIRKIKENLENMEEV